MTMNNITILFLSTLLIAFVSYHYSKLRYLSPTFWASASTCVFAGIYVATYDTMLNDISEKTLVVILSAITSVALGCILSGIFTKYSQSDQKDFIDISTFSNQTNELIINKKETIILTICYFILACSRLGTLIRLTGGSFTNIMDLITDSRDLFVSSESKVSLGGVFFNQFIYAFEIATYIHIYVYIYNYLLAGIKHKYLLLPLIPDLLNRLATTSRSAFIYLVFIIYIIYCLINLKYLNKKRIRISTKNLIFIFAFIVAFFAYGRRRNNLDNSIIENLQMYTASGIFNYDLYLRYGWDNNPFFGYHTLQKIYAIIGLYYQEPIRLPAQITGVNLTRSNIYTSLFTTTLDFGIVGMCIIRFFESFCGSIIIRVILKARRGSYINYYMLNFYLITLYAFANFPIGNRFAGFLGDPITLARYFIYGCLIIKYFLKPHFVCFVNGEERELSICRPLIS